MLGTLTETSVPTNRVTNRPHLQTTCEGENSYCHCEEPSNLHLHWPIPLGCTYTPLHKFHTYNLIMISNPPHQEESSSPNLKCFEHRPCKNVSAHQFKTLVRMIFALTHHSPLVNALLVFTCTTSTSPPAGHKVPHMAFPSQCGLSPFEAYGRARVTMTRQDKNQCGEM